MQLPGYDVMSVSYAQHAHVYQPGQRVVSANTSERNDEKGSDRQPAAQLLAALAELNLTSGASS